MGGTAYQDFFARVECKYLLTSRQYEALLPDVEEMASVDQYGRTRILNIYYDTPDYRLIRTSLERPSYKEKLRLRSYGIPQEDTQVYLEIKKSELDNLVKLKCNSMYVDSPSKPTRDIKTELGTENMRRGMTPLPN